MDRFYPKSILCIPAMQWRRYIQHVGSADICLIDLEDSVSYINKENAREEVFSFFSKPYKKLTALRLNSLNSLDGIKDLILLSNLEVKPDFIFLTKVKNYREVTQCRNIIKYFSDNIKIYTVIEESEAFFDLCRIASESDGVIFGSADYAAELLINDNWSTMLFARHQLINAAAMANIPCIDSPCFSVEGSNAQQLQDECEKSASIGFCGKIAIHPKQINTINKGFSLSENIVSDANEVIDSYKKSDGNITTLNGWLVGPPFVIRASRILSRYKKQFKMSK